MYNLFLHVSENNSNISLSPVLTDSLLQLLEFFLDCVHYTERFWVGPTVSMARLTK